ncbi:hypothetical protein ISCGN_008952 [Ixodes scapularis]
MSNACILRRELSYPFPPLKRRGLRTKKSAAVITARQLTESHLDAEYNGRTRVFTDGSVDLSGGKATAAAFFEAAAVGIHERLSHQASSTTAELAAIRLVLWGIRTGCARGLSRVVLSDSRAALGLLSGLERDTPLARSVAQDAAELQEKGHEIILQWIPSHCGIRGNEVADSLAAQAQKKPRMSAFYSSYFLRRQAFSEKYHHTTKSGPESGGRHVLSPSPTRVGPSHCRGAPPFADRKRLHTSVDRPLQA